MPHSAKLRKVGGSVVMAIPPYVLQQLKLKIEDEVQLRVDDGVLMVEPKPAISYRLEDLLAEELAGAEKADADDWVRDGTVGRELL